MKLTPLVSICVVTYNSEKYVIETLESIKGQTYRNIELIISDDCSSDDTVPLCKEWIEDNKEQFVNVTLIASPVNTGIPANCNRGFFKAKGEWVKSIAGDDLLLPTCIEDNVRYVQEYPEVKFLFSKREEFGNDAEEIKVVQESRASRQYFYDLPVEKQFWDLIIKECCIGACTQFIDRFTFNLLGGFDESIPLYEDYPMWVKATREGYKMYFMDKYTVRYRIHSGGISFGNKNKRKKDNFKKSVLLSFKKYRYPYLKQIDKVGALYKYLYFKQHTKTTWLGEHYYLFLRLSLRIITLRKNMRIDANNEVSCL